jgi:DNA-binding beta-propeller fold protein YncE
MNPIRWGKSVSLALILLLVNTLTIAAPLEGPPDFVNLWRTGNPSMPWGIAVGHDDRVYVATYQISMIQVFSPDGEQVGIWGEPGTSPGHFNGPVGMAVGPDGNIYVADSENARVQIFTPDGAYIREITHPESFEVGFKPWGIALDPAGNLYVSVLNSHTIYKFGSDGDLIQSIGGFGFSTGLFTGPTGLAVNNNELYVVDSLAFRIQVFTLDGAFVRTWGSLCDIYIHPGRGCVDPDGDEGPLESGDGQLSSPWGVAIDSEGRVYVADSANKRIVIFSSDGEFITKWGELGQGEGQFDNSVGVAINSFGDVYVSDLNNNRIQHFAFPAVEEEAEPAAPVVLDVQVPDVAPVDGSLIEAQVQFEDINGDLTEARFHVIDGKFDPFRVDLTQFSGQTSGEFTFNYSCPIAQEITLKLLLVDSFGNASEPQAVVVNCGDPLSGNYDAEQAIPRATDTTLGINIVILADGVNTMAEGAIFSGDSIITSPREEVRLAFENHVVPAVNGIWDQCGIDFELNSISVVDPRNVQISGGNLDQQLISRGSELAEIALNEPGRRRPLELLTESLEPLSAAASATNIDFDSTLLTAYIAGARLVQKLGEERHFGGVTTLNGKVSLVRWDSLFFTDSATGAILPAKRPTTAIAHEFGHNFGLIHNNDSDDPAVNSDSLNLMFSNSDQPTAVPPQPTVNLVQPQCEIAASTIDQLGL